MPRISHQLRDHLMFALGTWSLFFALVLGVPGCSPFIPAPVPPPIPTPTPEPPQPQPTPEPPQPQPTAHTVTAEEYDAVVVGTTTEQDLIVRFGSPLKRSAINAPGTTALVYPATDAQGKALAAEFWVRAGVVVNKNRL